MELKVGELTSGLTSSGAQGKLFEVIKVYPLARGYVFAPTYMQAILTAGLLFLLVLTLGQLRRRIIGWQLGGVVPGMMFGFVLALLMEGIMIVGGRTILTELLGWRSAPKPITKALDAGRGELVEVLGVTEEVPTSEAAADPTVGGMMSDYEKLTSEEKESLESIICK